MAIKAKIDSSLRLSVTLLQMEITLLRSSAEHVCFLKLGSTRLSRGSNTCKYAEWTSRWSGYSFVSSSYKVSAVALSINNMKKVFQ